MESSNIHISPTIEVPLRYRIGETRGDQVAARECYVVMLEMEEQMTTMNIKE